MAVNALQGMELVNDTGFMNRIQFIVFDVARDAASPAPAPGSDDEAFVDAVLNGANDMRLIAIAVVVVNASPEAADDASLKTTVEAVWPFFAASWNRLP